MEQDDANSHKDEETMKYIRLGYFDEKKWETISESERRRSRQK
jgi:hypothetical protein